MAALQDERAAAGSSAEPHSAPRSADDPAAPFDAYSEIVALARTGIPHSQFMVEVLGCVARFFASPYAALHVRYSSQVVQEDCHRGPTAPGFWKPSVQEFLTESLAEVRSRAKLLRSRSGSAKVAFLSVPMFDSSGPTIGAIALVIAPVDDDHVNLYLAQLEALVRLASFSAEFLGTAGGKSPTIAGVGQALTRAARCSTTVELAYAITNELRNKLGSEQVCLGLVNRRHVRIISISGLDEVRKQSPGVVSIRSAMEECLDAGAPIVMHQGGSWAQDGDTCGYRLHKQWHAAAKGDAVASIPLKADERIVAILSLRCREDMGLDAARVEEIRAKVEPFAPALVLTERASRRLGRHILDTASAVFEAVTTPGRSGAKIATLVVGAFALWFCLGKMDYELGVPCVITPAEVRHISAPYDGVIASADFIDGDRVSGGDIICELDQRDLEQQRAQLLAELNVAERAMDRARANESPVEVQLALANRRLTEAKLDIVNRRLERAAMRAPFDGVIVAGDLRKRIGGVVAKGEPLFEVAPLDRWALQLAVPEAASAEVVPGLLGAFASYARPEDVREFRLSRVLAGAEVRGSRNVYVAEAEIGALADWMRPGMDGVAKVRIGRRPVWWIALHRVIDYLRINLWL